MEKKKGIIAKVTGQKIEALLQMGVRKIEIPYYFTEVPQDVPGAIINTTQHHRVVDDTDGNETDEDMIDKLKYSLQEYLSEYALQFNLESRIMEEDDEPEQEEVIFLLTPHLQE